ncbi:AAA family ATPase [uncultured Pseudokineococcus sp.]|uniref:AAA family ATPase n=1 Tax=uncultured Pseudokineococcus sp. TaxID=1642928 RepID=UPI00262F3389|nr:AAA family ATPase [uncultured Pseudokineococcus sp.]
MRTLPPGLVTTPAAQAQPAPAPQPVASAHHADPDLAAALFATWSGDPAVVVSSPPGAGKTRLVTHLADQLARRAGLTIALAAQTRAQAADLTARLAALTPDVGLLAASKTPRPGWVPASATWLAGAAAARNFTGIVVATSARWAWTQPRDFHADVLLVDEAYQLTFADAGSLGALAEQVVMVGDPSQIDPVVTGVTTRWAHSPAGPHQPAPSALVHLYPEHVTQQRLSRTWRLGPVTTGLIQPTLYPDLPFTSARPHSVLHHDAQPLPEVTTLPVAVTGRTDARLAAAAADRARALLGTTLTETDPATGQVTTRRTTAADVAVIAPHVEQVAAIAAHLADEPDVLVATANQAQGSERHAVVAVHPLAGYRALPSYATDTGRLCVTLSRHRSHLSLVTDPTTPDVLARALRREEDPATSVHASVLDALGSA